VPELPEVETIVRDLQPAVVGRRITAVHVSRKPLRRQWRPVWKNLLIGRGICEVRRRGKWIVLALDGDLFLVIHLGMTGQLQVMPGPEPVADHTHVICHLDGNEKQLRFRDIRRFGSATVFQGTARLNAFFQESELGPEPFDLKGDYFRCCLAKTARCLKAVLLDQRVVAGVGNIYADEALFESRLHPARLGLELSPTEAGRLGKGIVKVLNRAITLRGSTIRNYIGASGKKGKYQDEFRVYGRVGEPCPRCRKPIRRIRLAGRSTHFCPGCQKRGAVV
jgi:formamidopyrimidine-DNA glycosylase